MSMNLIALLYLVASVFFIQALKGLSHPTTSIRGNVFGMTGMTIAVLTTIGLIHGQAQSLALNFGEGIAYVLGALVIGGGAGAIMAKRVEMTKMPELVAFMHSMIGLAAVFIAVAAAVEPWAFGITAKAGAIPYGNRLELALGAAIGAITFSGSVIAFGKLSGTYKFRLFQGKPVVFAGQHKLNAALGLAAAFFCFGFWHSQSAMDFGIVTALGFALGDRGQARQMPLHFLNRLGEILAYLCRFAADLAGDAQKLFAFRHRFADQDVGVMLGLGGAFADQCLRA